MMNLCHKETCNITGSNWCHLGFNRLNVLYFSYILIYLHSTCIYPRTYLEMQPPTYVRTYLLTMYLLYIDLPTSLPGLSHKRSEFYFFISHAYVTT